MVEQVVVGGVPLHRQCVRTADSPALHFLRAELAHLGEKIPNQLRPGLVQAQMSIGFRQHHDIAVHIAADLENGPGRAVILVVDLPARHAVQSAARRPQPRPKPPRTTAWTISNLARFTDRTLAT
ncbi:hypothetical protein [Saccharopolyspora sp. NPDC003762]